MEIARALIASKVGEVRVVEPNLREHPEFKLLGLEQAVADADIVVVLVPHKEFKRLPAHLLAEKIIIDVCGALRQDRTAH